VLVLKHSNVAIATGMQAFKKWIHYTLEKGVFCGT
jgi:hypothetical protein